jgi:VWFA-related protein
MNLPGLLDRLPKGDTLAGFTMMNRVLKSRSLLYLLLCSAPAGLPQQSSAPPPSPSDPVLVNRPPPAPVQKPSAVTAEGRIHLDVLVSDAAGKPVLGLSPLDFKLLDNNQPRRILSFRSFDGTSVKPNPPVEVILLFDTANLLFSQVAFTRQEIARFLRQNNGQLSQPVSLMVVSEAGLRIQPRPSVDGNALLSVLDQVKGGIHSINAAMGAEGELERLQLSLRQMTTIAENEARRPGRKLLIWVGPGWPMLDSKSFTFSEKDQRRYFDAIVELSTKLREARMALYSVALSDSAISAGMHTNLYQDFLKPVTSSRQADTGNLALKVLALQSGGRILGPDNDLVKQIDACIDEADDEYHDLKVQISQPGLAVRTNTGYYNQP